MSDTDSPSSETPEWVGKPESTGAPSRTRKKTSEESGSGGDDEEVPVRKHAKRKAPSKEPKKPKPTVVRLLQQNGEVSSHKPLLISFTTCPLRTSKLESC
jgi:hypothetical protein